MTEKRFKRLVSSIDYYYCIDSENKNQGLTEEDMLDKLNELSEENEQIENSIKEAIRNERTDMGRNALIALAVTLGIEL